MNTKQNIGIFLGHLPSLLVPTMTHWVNPRNVCHNLQAWREVWMVVCIFNSTVIYITAPQI